MATDASVLAGGEQAPPEPVVDEILENDDGDFPFEEVLAEFRSARAEDGTEAAEDDDFDPEGLEEPPTPKKAEPAAKADDDEPEVPKGVRERIAKAARARDEAREEAQRRAAEAAEERRLREEMEARLADMEARLADPEPDFDSDPDKWREWAKRDKAREVERAKKAREAAARPAEKPATAAQVDPAAQRVEASVAAARGRYSDYARFVNPAVIARINNDPAVYDRVMMADDPGEAAYRYGREAILGEKPEREERAGAGRLSAGGAAFGSGPRASRGPTTREEKFVSKFVQGWGMPRREGGR